MSLVEGAAQFGARVLKGTPRVVPRERSPWGPQTSVVLKKGHPVQSISGTQVSLMQIHDTGTAQYMSGAKFYGFMAQDENAQHSLDLPGGGAFATLTKIYYGVANNRSGFELCLVYPNDGVTVFSMAITSGQTVTRLLPGNTYSLKWDPTLEQVTIDPSNTTYALATVIGVRPGDEGKTDGTGQVDFIVLDSKSQYLQP